MGRYLRPEVPAETAIVALMDARGVLYELRVCTSGLVMPLPGSLSLPVTSAASNVREPLQLEWRPLLTAVSPARHDRLRGKSHLSVLYPDESAAQDLAATSPDSRERFEARRLLPGMAKRLREV